MQRKERQASRRRLAARHLACCADGALPRHRTRTPRRAGAARARAAPRRTEASIRSHGQRSEEHTSELQSRLHLVCRLLLEKKKKKTHTNIRISLTRTTSTVSSILQQYDNTS